MKHAIFWWIAFSAALVSWLIIIVSRFYLPETVQIPWWQLNEQLQVSPSLILDDHSWLFSIAILTLCLSALLITLVTESQTSRGPRLWKSWVVMLVISALSVLAVFPGDLITLLLTWTLLDLTEFTFNISALDESSQLERLVISFSGRLAGTFIVIWTLISAMTNGYSLSFTALQPQSATLLLLAAGFRLGVLPPIPSLFDSRTLSRNSGVVIRLAPLATSLLLIARLSPSFIPNSLPLWVAGVSLVTLVSSIAWLVAKDENRAVSFWLISTSGLTIAGGYKASSESALVWGIALILLGALLFLSNSQTKLQLPLLFLGGLGLSCLPFTVTWPGVWIYSSPFSWTSLVFLWAQILLLSGFFRYLRKKKEQPLLIEPSTLFIYILSLLLLLGMSYFAGWSILQSGDTVHYPTLIESWPSLAIFILAITGYILSLRIRIDIGSWLERNNSRFTMTWLYHIAGTIYQMVSKVFSGINSILEGKAGVFWAFLLFILLASFLAQVLPGG